MMGWGKLFAGLVSLFNKLGEYLRFEQIAQAGEDRERNRQLEAELERRNEIDEAKEAANNLGDDDLDRWLRKPDEPKE